MSQLEMFKPNLPPNLKQILFDKVVDGLSAQGFKRSVVNPHTVHVDCLYRSPTGMKCALGQIIPDDQYNPDWEKFIPSEQDPKGRAITTACGLNPDNYDDVQWLLALQHCHDKGESPEMMVHKLHDFAKIYKLDSSNIPNP